MHDKRGSAPCTRALSGYATWSVYYSRTHRRRNTNPLKMNVLRNKFGPTSPHATWTTRHFDKEAEQPGRAEAPSMRSLSQSTNAHRFCGPKSCAGGSLAGPGAQEPLPLGDFGALTPRAPKTLYTQRAHKFCGGPKSCAGDSQGSCPRTIAIRELSRIGPARAQDSVHSAS
jgi:hypothetical protein